MSWPDHHKESEQFAGEAQLALQRGAVHDASALYRKAADAESRALASLDPRKTRTIGITAVSACALWYKARDFRQLENVAYKWLSSTNLPGFAIDQLRELLQRVWSEETLERAGVRITGEGVLVALKGGDVVVGGAPLDLVLEKVDEMRALVYRTAEFLTHVPHRRRGGPSLEMLQSCRPWLFQASTASYQFAVTIQEPKQTAFPFGGKVTSSSIVAKLLDVLRASIEDPEESLANSIPDREYRSTFLKLARNLAPSGKALDRLEIRNIRASTARPIVLLPDVRHQITSALKSQAVRPTGEQLVETRLSGVLRALHLDQDWLEIAVDEPGGKHVRVESAGEAVDDVVGPMVNRHVIVEAARTPQGKHLFRDIQAAE